MYLVFCARAFLAQEYLVPGIEDFVLGYFVPIGIYYLVFSVSVERYFIKQGILCYVFVICVRVFCSTRVFSMCR